MTLGTFAPLVAAVGALLMVALAVVRQRALPGPTDMGYDEAAVARERRTLSTGIAAQLAVPVLLYVVLNVLTDIGTLKLF